MSKTVYIYENHIDGGLYDSDHKLSYKERYCESCGDLDWLVCEATSPDDIWRAVEDEIDVDGSGGWDRKYVEEFINSIQWE